MRRASVRSLASSLRLRGFSHFVPPASPSALRRQTPDRSREVKSGSARRKGHAMPMANLRRRAQKVTVKIMRARFLPVKPLKFEGLDAGDFDGTVPASHRACVGFCSSF